jgi:hypothetical protein
MWKKLSAERIYGGEQTQPDIPAKYHGLFLPDVRLAWMTRAIRSRYPFIRRLIFMTQDSPLRIVIGY